MWSPRDISCRRVMARGFVSVASMVSFQSQRTHLLVVVSLVGVLLASLPIWWSLTTIERRALPAQHVREWGATGKCPVRKAVQVRLAKHGDIDAEALCEATAHELQQGSFHVDGEQAGDACLDWMVSTRDNSTTAGAYEVDVRLEPGCIADSQDLQVCLHTADVKTAARAIAAKFAPFFGKVARGRDDSHIVQYSRKLRLVFSLLNENASAGGAVAGWDLGASLAQLAESLDNDDVVSSEVRPLLPLRRVLQAARGVHDIALESQVQWFAPLEFEPHLEIVASESHVDAVRTEAGEHSGAHQASTAVSSYADASPIAEEKVGYDMGGSAAMQHGESLYDARDVMASGNLAHDVHDPGEDASSESFSPASSVSQSAPGNGIHASPKADFFASADDLRVFINSAQWNLESYGRAASSHMDKLVEHDNEQVLHFVLFLPSSTHSPLRVRDPVSDGVIAQPAWLVSQWGGVVVWNRDAPRQTAPDANIAAEALLSTPLTLDELAQPIELFSSQLSSLLGIYKDAATAPSQIAIDGLAWRRTLEATRRTVETLEGILRLVEKIPNLGVNALVRDEVELALEKLEQVRATAHERPPSSDIAERSLEAASDALTHASRAFFHPSMLGMLYFPDEHKYAIYTPLFGPLLLPLIAALVREIKLWKRRRSKCAATAD